MSKRISSFDEFWEFYLREHRDPRSRKLHFVGTTGFVASCAVSTLLNPLSFPTAVGASIAAFRQGMAREPKGRPIREVLGVLGPPTAAAPLTFPAGVAFAYGCAWAGHFLVERNRPATFDYPLWSLYADLKMWLLMLTGKLWEGDPLEELELEKPPRVFA